ncbi:MAG: DUF4012 domain-containing protein [Bifidobacteriaceae bacterium]|jgi:hypothetical protein|nr:DUF4012 domain-containing protein [Bifidobacteriaceae bacterium]
MGLTIGVLIAVGAWAGWHLYTLGTNALHLAGLVDTVQQHAKQGDVPALIDDLYDVHRYSVAAYNAASDPTVMALHAMPGIGDDLRAAREVTRVARDLTAATGTLASMAPRVTGNQILTEDGRIDLTLIGTVHTAMTELASAAEAGSKRLGSLDQGSLLPQIGEPIDRLVGWLEQVPGAVDRAEPYLQLLPLLLGENDERTWFVIMQNLDEARPSGGLLASWLVLHANNGLIEVLAQGTNDDLTATGNVDYSHAMDASYRTLWGDNLSGWLSMNLSANFPDNARLMRDAWNARGEAQVDGVVSFGQGTLPYLAAAVGPVDAGERSIAPADLEEYLRVGVYRDYEDPDTKDKMVASLMIQVFDKLMAGNLNLGYFLDTVTGYESADRVQMWSADPTIQQTIAAADLSGEFPSAEGPVSTVRLVNAGGNKLDTFMDLDVAYLLGDCEMDEEYDVEWRTSTMTVKLTNSVPDGLPPYMTGRLDLIDEGVDPSRVVVGSNRDFVVIYAPVGATIASVTVDGAEAYVHGAELSGREVALVDVETNPGTSRIIKVTWSEPATDSVGRALPTSPEVVLPPLANPVTLSLEPGNTCP